MPTDCWGVRFIRSSASSKRRRKNAGKRSRSIRILPSRITPWPSTIWHWAGWGKPRTFFGGPPSENWNSPTCWLMDSDLIDPDFAIAYNTLALNNMALGRLGEAENVLRRASERKLELPDLLVDGFRSDRSGFCHRV